MSSEPELWKVVPGWEHYHVSNLGRIKGPRGIRLPVRHPTGYLQITLNKGSIRQNFKLHRLVCTVFHGPPPFEGAMALHKNHIRDDCREDNLYWGTAQDNTNDMHKAGRQATSKGEANGNSSLTWDKVREIRARYAAGESQSDLGTIFNVHQSTLSLICNNHTWVE